jgi:mono/diheme cytochrome c family protein
MSMKNTLVAFASIALATAVGCNKADPGRSSGNQATTAVPAAVAAAPADPTSEAQTLFKTRCSVCHGQAGEGDGPGAAALNPKPRAFKDASWQTSVTDEQIGKTIVEGGAATGKSPTMPGNPDLQGKPDVVKALIGILRGLKKG